jgi:hypothetical protein
MPTATPSGKKNRRNYFMAKLTLTPTQRGLLEVLLKHQRRKVLQLARPPTPFLFTHVKRVATIIAALGFLFGLWFGVSTYHGPRPSYPYYDPQKPVPPWREPAPLESNHNTGGDYK